MSRQGPCRNRQGHLGGETASETLSYIDCFLMKTSYIYKHVDLFTWPIVSVSSHSNTGFCQLKNYSNKLGYGIYNGKDASAHRLAIHIN